MHVPALPSVSFRNSRQILHGSTAAFLEGFTARRGYATRNVHDKQEQSFSGKAGPSLSEATADLREKSIPHGHALSARIGAARPARGRSHDAVQSARLRPD